MSSIAIAIFGGAVMMSMPLFGIGYTLRRIAVTLEAKKEQK